MVGRKLAGVALFLGGRGGKLRSRGQYGSEILKIRKESRFFRPKTAKWFDASAKTTYNGFHMTSCHGGGEEEKK